MVSVGLIGLLALPAVLSLPTAIAHPALGLGHFLYMQER